MQHQDWETVILRKPKPPPKQNQSSRPKIEKDGEEFNLLKIDQNLKTAIQKARVASKMSQKQLAQKLNVLPQDIANYESGKAIPNNQFIARIERALNTKLPRAKKQPTNGA